MNKPKVSADEARQAEKTGRMRTVLTLSIIGAVIALAIVFVVVV